MKITEFQKIKEFDNINNIQGNENDLFLVGDNMRDQKFNKQPGDLVTFYKIFHKDEKSGIINYVPITIRLEKEK